MNRCNALIVALPGLLLCATEPARGATTYFSPATNYRKASDSPFASMMNSASHAFWLETFEDGLMNSLGVTASPHGVVRAPGNFTDSVDGDGAGVLDGFGKDGYSFMAPTANPFLTFTFNAALLGQLPTHAGLVWTDGSAAATVTLEGFNAQGGSIGVLTAQLGDAVNQGSTGEDRFMGLSWEQGIAWMTIRVSTGGLEVDHLQYGYAMAGGEVVPVPPALGLGAAGMGLVAAVRRRRKLRA